MGVRVAEGELHARAAGKLQTRSAALRCGPQESARCRQERIRVYFLSTEARVRVSLQFLGARSTTAPRLPRDQPLVRPLFRSNDPLLGYPQRPRKAGLLFGQRARPRKRPQRNTDGRRSGGAAGLLGVAGWDRACAEGEEVCCGGAGARDLQRWRRGRTCSTGSASPGQQHWGRTLLGGAGAQKMVVCLREARLAM